MIRDITIGQYYKADSIIHKLDPRLKIIGTLLYIISLFLFNKFYGFIPVILFLGLVTFLSKVPVKYIFKGLKPFILMLLFTAGLNIFFIPGKNLFSYGIIHISYEGLKVSLFMILRLLLLVAGSTIMTLTTTPTRLTDGIESLLSIFKIFKIPAHEIAMMMSIALRFIPLLIDESDKIIKAQKARGADFETGNIVTRLKNMLPILIPLFVSAIRRATDLAYAMDARCYTGGENRTKMFPLKYTKKDYIALVICLAYLAILIIL